MLDLAMLELPHQVEAFLNADNEAAWNALADANKLPHPLEDRVLVDSCQVDTISLCARLGLETHVSYLFNRASLYEKEIIFDVRGRENVFHAACQGGHLPVVERLITLAQDKVMALVEMNNFESFQLACASGNPLLGQRLVQLVLDQLAETPQLAHEKVQAMVEAGNFKAFQLACYEGRLTVLNWLVGLAPDKMLAMVVAEDFLAFQMACQGGHLTIVERLIELVNLSVPPELASKKVLAMVKAQHFFPFQKACVSGQLAVVDRLVELVSQLAPYDVTDMLEAVDCLAFHAACEGGQLAVVNRLVELAPDIVSAVLKNWGHIAFKSACEGGHLAIVERLIELVTVGVSEKPNSDDLPSELDPVESPAPDLAPVLAMVEATSFKAFESACKGGHLTVVDRLIELVTQLAPQKVIAMVEANGFVAFQSACAYGKLAVIDRLIELVSELAPDKVLTMVERYGWNAFRSACLRGHIAVFDRLVELVSELAPGKVQAMVEARNFEAFINACQGGHLAIIEKLIALAPDKLMAMIEVGWHDYQNFASFQIACENGHFLVVKRLIELVSERAPDRVQAMLEADNFHGLKKAYWYGFYPTADLLLRNEFVLRYAVDDSETYSRLVSGFVNIELNILAATKSVFEAENPGLRFNIPQDRVSYYVLMLGHMCGCEDFPNRQKHIDLLMGLPRLNPLPAEHYQWCLDKALNANNAKTALRLLSKYPGPKDVATESGRIKIKPIHELFILEGEDQVPLMHNLHLLQSKMPLRYQSLFRAVRLNAATDSKVYNTLSGQSFTDVELLWKQVEQALREHSFEARAPIIKFRNYWRISKGLSTASTIAASASAPKPSRGPGR